MDEAGRDSPITLSDGLLLERLRQGDEAGFETLFLRYYDRVYGLLFRLLGSREEAEDLAQEVFLKLYRRPLGRGREHHLQGWLYRVALNAGYNAIRSHQREARWQEALARETTIVGDDAASGDPVGEALRREEREQVRAVLAQLPPRQGQLLLLRHMGLSYKELAEVAGVSPTSVGTLLARAARAFKKAYVARAGVPKT